MEWVHVPENPLSYCRFNEILRSLWTFIPQDQQGGPSIRESALWYGGERRHQAWRVNGLDFSSFDIDMVQLRFAVAEKQSARAQQAARCYNASVAARVAIRTSKSQSKSEFLRLQVATEVIIEALKVFKEEVAESKGQFP